MLTAIKALNSKHLDDTQLMNMKLDLYKEMSYRKMNTQTRKGIYNFLLHYVNFNEHEMLKKLEQTIKKITGRSTSMGTEEYLLEKAKIKGLEQGIKQGRQQGEEAEKWKIAGKLKAMGFDLVKITEITGLTTTQIEKL